jgi:hypothetical protein
MTSHRALSVVAAVLAVAFAWFATGVKPFHTLSYVVVGIPVLVVVSLYLYFDAFADERSGSDGHQGTVPVSLSRSTPWLLVLFGAIILETVGLALGGQSSRVPTLSTTMDHLLTTHVIRCVLFLLWWAIGVAPLRRWRENRQRAVSE